VKTVAAYFASGLRAPFASTLATSKLIVRGVGFDISFIIAGTAITVPDPAAASAAAPNACRRVSRIGQL